MMQGKKVVVVMPAYNASKTLHSTYLEIPFDIVDEVVLVDDCSNDDTIFKAKKLGIQHVLQHNKNIGYGGNQKTCYQKAIELGADIIIMVHPDYQYTPRLITAMAAVIANDVYPVMFGSRILGKGALRGGMPVYKYLANRFLTLFQNIFFNEKLSEYHTGYRAFSADVLRTVPFTKCSNDFIFDNQIIAQLLQRKYLIGEITCPTCYFSAASSINFRRACKYGWGCVKVAILYRLHQWKLIQYSILDERT
jgi:glycosyltransferase involved in cell wall biosynthesis